MDCSPPCVKEEPKIYLSVSLKFFLESVKHLGLWNSFKFFVSLSTDFPILFFFFATLKKKKKSVCVHLFLQVCVYLPSRDWPVPQALDQVRRAARLGGGSIHPLAEARGQTKLILWPCLPAACFCQDLSCVVFLYFGSSKLAPHTVLVPPGIRWLSFPFLHMWKNAEFFKITKECDSHWKACTADLPCSTGHACLSASWFK